MLLTWANRSCLLDLEHSLTGSTEGLSGWVYFRRIIKGVIQRLSLVVALPFAALTGFGRFSLAFQGCGHLFSLFPGLIGDYLRVAFYVWTLRECSLDCRISFGAFFAYSSAVVREGVYIGPYCVLGNCEIGERTQIASHVQILSGRHQHQRQADGRILGTTENELSRVVIGKDCWIGAAAIVMADVGFSSTIGAGAVVTRAILDNIVAVGNPARPLEGIARE
jgi:acetyltransferase-like isoleucine patch superfamily enzyme